MNTFEKDTNFKLDYDKFTKLGDISEEMQACESLERRKQEEQGLKKAIDQFLINNLPD